MRFTTLLTPLALLSGSVTLAAPSPAPSSSTINDDGASILTALSKVNNATVKLGTDVASWKQWDILGTLPIIAASTALLVDVEEGTETAKKSAALDTTGALAVAGATNTLVSSVNTTLGDLIAAKPKFDELLLSGVIYIDLGLQRKATAGMSDAIIEKVPEALQAIAKGLVAPIDASFALAIAVFQP